jgi:hypothetical protein
VVNDKLEKDFPDIGLIEIEDNETGELRLVDSSSHWFRESFKKKQDDEAKMREKNLLRSQVETIKVESSAEDFTAPLITFFKKRG